jgi:hypothetical protein
MGAVRAEASRMALVAVHGGQSWRVWRRCNSDQGKLPVVRRAGLIPAGRHRLRRACRIGSRLAARTAMAPEPLWTVRRLRW